MARLLAIVRSFWFCIAMAVWSLNSLANELVEGVDPWFSVIIVMLWVYLGWRNIQRHAGEESD